MQFYADYLHAIHIFLYKRPIIHRLVFLKVQLVKFRRRTTNYYTVYGTSTQRWVE